MEKSIIKMLNEAGYNNSGDNRNYEIKSLNNLLNIGMIDFQFIPAEKYNSNEGGRSYWYNSADGKRRSTAYIVYVLDGWYNGHFMPKKRRVDFGGFLGVVENDVNYPSIELYDVLCRVASLISKKKSGYNFLSTGECSCSKCNGTGIIPQFLHYANGICFDCGGSGIDKKVLKSLIASNLNKI